MGVNLRATATLNGKPFLATLKTLSAATAKQNKSAIKGNSAVSNSLTQQIAAHEGAARAASSGSKSLTAATGQSTRANRNLVASQAEVNRELIRTGAAQGIAIDSMSKMTAAQQRQLTSARAYSRELQRHSQLVAGGLEGPAAVASAQRVERAAASVANANRAVAAETNKIATASAAAAANQAAQAKAMTAGTTAARNYATGLSALSQDKLKLQAATERLGAAEGRLASAMARSNGLITPAVHSARAGVISAQQAYTKLAEAQKSAGKAGAGVASGLAAQRYLYHDMSRQVGTLSIGLAALPAIGIVTASVWEKSFADVVRTSDPFFSKTPAKVDALRSSLVDMAQAMPTSFTATTEIATLANQMGIAASETASFTRAVAMFSATSGVAVDMAATAFGRLTSILGDRSIGFMEMADSILKVGVNSVATEDEIINVTTQISSIAAQAGFSAKEMIGLSGALASVRVPPELSRGVVTRVFGQIDKAVSAGGTGLDSLARISGTTAEKFRQDWGTERSAGLFNGFLQGLRDAGQAARGELRGLGITSVRDQPVLLRLANAADSDGNVGELLTQTMRDANNAAGETQRQYVIMADTVVGKLKVLGNNILAFFDGAGRSGLGIMGDLLDKLSSGIRNITDSLEEPNALFGMFGKTNADIIGLTGTVMLAVSAFTLLGSGYLKFMAAVKASQHLMSLTGLIGGATGAAAGGGAIGAFTKNGAAAAGTAKKLTGVLGKAGSFLMGPWGIALAVGATALSVLNSAMEKNVTTGEDLSVALSRIDVSNLAELDFALSSVTTKGLLGSGTMELNSKPFAEGVDGVQAAMDKLTGIKDANQYNWFGGKATSEPLQWLDRTVQGAWDDVAALEQLDSAVQNLADAGNGDKAVKMLQAVGGSGERLMAFLNSAEGSKSKSFLQNAFDLAGLEMTEASLDRLATGRLPALTDAMYGAAGATAAVEEIFDSSGEAYAEFAQTIDGAAASFISFGSAVEKATSSDSDGNFASFDLTEFSKTLRQQVSEQEQWVKDITTISQHGSSQVVESLAAMGPDGKQAAKALAQGLRDGTPEAVAALEAMEAAVTAQVVGIGNALAVTMANQSWASKILGSNDLARELTNALGDDKMSTLYEAAEGVGSETVERVLQGLSRGDMSWDEAMANLIAGQPLKIPVAFEGMDEGATKAAIDRGMAALSSKWKGEYKVPLGFELNAATTVGELKTVLNDPALNTISIDGDLSLTDAYAESREFQVWAANQQIDMLLGADDSLATQSVSMLIARITGTVTQIQVDAVGAPAEGKIWEVVHMANGETAFIQVDGTTGKAESQIAKVVDKAGKTVGTVKVDADTYNATSKIGALQKTTYSTHVVTVQEIVDSNAKWGKPGASGGMADGGLVSYYANGGINSRHVAQVAPAGAMRVWAEPETEGEAYIPFARSKRTRSLAILDQVAQRFGYGLSSASNVTQFADGGQYMAQTMSRQRFANPSVRGSGSDAGVRFGDVTFVQENNKDQFREFTRHVNRVARGL